MANSQVSTMDQEAVTVANTPEPEQMPTDSGLFAVLRPSSVAAQKAFDATVNKVIEGGSHYDHPRTFLQYNRNEGREGSPHTEDEASGSAQQSYSPEYVGFYKLSLNNPPHDAFHGWRLGCRGPGARTPVDILLCPRKHRCSHESCDSEVCESDHRKKAHCMNDPCTDKLCEPDHCKDSRSQSRGVAPYHVQLQFHPKLSSIVLFARHSVTISQPKAQVIKGSDSHILEDGELIVIEKLTQFRKNQYGPNFLLNKMLTPASIANSIRIGQFYSSPKTFASGTFGSVAAAWQHDGKDVFAVKRFKNTDLKKLTLHIDMMKCIGKHDHILTLEAFHYDLDQIPGYFAIYTPWVAADLAQVIEAKYHIKSSLKVMIFCDYLNGLCWLHEKGIMHRDLKPANLGILNWNEPRGYILDLDDATKEPTSYDHNKGTMVFLAPEILALKGWDSNSSQPKPPPYGKEIDVFALGLTMYGLYCDYNFSWSRFADSANPVPPRGSLTEELHGKFRAVLQSEIDRTSQDFIASSFLEMIGEMTIYESENRPDAKGLFEHISGITKEWKRDVIIPATVADTKRPGKAISPSQTLVKRPKKG